jgi:ABC-type polysaccharide/polyol phosphate transport system ATPase subunit
MTAPAISVDQLWKQFRLYHDKNQYLKTAILRGGRSRYEEFWALKDVSFEVPQGSTFGIIGSNGSGKSTMLKCLTGILSPDKGKVHINGKIAALLELGAGFHPDLSGRENIFLNGAILGMTSKEILRKLDEIVDFAGLEQFIDTPVKNYSSGMTVRLGFAIAINVDPEILIIDEVLAVGDIAFQQKCLEKIEDFRSDGRTIIFVSHGLGQVAQICDSVAWIEKGVLKELGDAQTVVSNYNALSHEAFPTLPNEIGQRWGSGEVSISAVELTGNNGAAQHQFHTGDPISIIVKYVSHISLDNASVSVRINHLHGTDIWRTSTESKSFVLPIREGDSQIRLNIDQLPLLDGTYDLSIVIADHSAIHEYDHWEKRIRFDVIQNDTFDTGLVDIKSTWEVDV